MNSNEDVEQYFTTRDIVAVYPNKIGLQQVFKSFVNQRKIKPVKSVRTRIKSGAFGLDRSIPVNCYNPDKIYKKIIEYVENPTYNLNSDKKVMLLELVELISNKIKSNLQ